MKKISDLIDRKRRIAPPAAIDAKTASYVFFEVVESCLKNIRRADFEEVNFREGVLVVIARHPGIASEIWRARERLIKKVNEKIGSEIVRQIRVK